jgi:group I intron endonuclease
MTNKINGKCYIGQTKNFKIRMNGHKSEAFNPNAVGYKYPLSNAIRKYGWENFENTIIEEIDPTESYEYVDERERFYISYYKSLSNENGYNITLGGQGCPKKPLTYEERLQLSNIFKADEIKDIQQMLKNGEQTTTIREKYYPRLSVSFLDNINKGLNFRNKEWTYPLRAEDISRSNYFTSQEIKDIKQDIKDNMTYKEISEKWNISLGMLSGINNGSIWHDNNEKYPLCIKSHSRKQNLETWVKSVQYDLMNSNLPMTEIAKKYDKAYSTIKKINYGQSHHNPEYLYPLTKNRKN